MLQIKSVSNSIRPYVATFCFSLYERLRLVVADIGHDMMEKWQSEFLQLIWQVGGLSVSLSLHLERKEQENVLQAHARKRDESYARLFYMMRRRHADQ